MPKGLVTVYGIDISLIADPYREPFASEYFGFNGPFHRGLLQRIRIYHQEPVSILLLVLPNHGKVLVHKDIRVPQDLAEIQAVLSFLIMLQSLQLHHPLLQVAVLQLQNSHFFLVLLGKTLHALINPMLFEILPFDGFVASIANHRVVPTDVLMGVELYQLHFVLASQAVHLFHVADVLMLL